MCAFAFAIIFSDAPSIYRAMSNNQKKKEKTLDTRDARMMGRFGGGGDAIWRKKSRSPTLANCLGDISCCICLSVMQSGAHRNDI